MVSGRGLWAANYKHFTNMEKMYILAPDSFTGTVLNTMPFVNVNTKHGADILNSTYVDYTDETFEKYNARHGGKLVALTWDDFNEQFYQPYLKSLQGPFEKTTKESFWDGLECLPPKRWTQFEGGEFFFVGECYTGNLYNCYVRKGEIYYSAIRAINTSSENIINLV